MTTRLWIEQIDNSFAPGDETIGPWCFEGREAIVPDWYLRPFENPFEDKNKLITDSKQACILFDSMAKKMAPLLNREHGLDHSPAFWRHILTGWLLFLIHLSWARYAHIKMFIKNNTNKKFSVRLAPPDYKWPFAIAHDLVKNAPLPDFDFWLSSLIIDEISPKNWDIQTIENFTPDMEFSNYSYSTHLPLETLRDKIRYPFRKILFSYLKTSRFGNVYGTTWKEQLILSILLNLKPRVHKPRKPLHQNTLLPEASSNGYFPDEYLRILNRLTDKTIPASLGSGFSKYYQTAAKNKFTAGKVRVGTPDIFREVEKIETALAAEKGELVLQTQHGSWYGMIACPTVAQAAEYSLYGFLSWGWNKHDNFNGHFIPAPSPMLSGYAGKYAPSTENLLFVNNKTYTRSSRLEGQPMPAQTVRDRQDKMTFLQTLQPDIRKTLLYRPHMHHNCGIDDQSFIKKHFPDLRFLLDKSMDRELLRCKLFVANHYSTGFHIAMAADIPSICFWQPNVAPVAQTAIKEHALLQDCRIVFNTPEEAARHINNIWPSVKEWWYSDKVRKARAIWCEKHARTDKAYLKQWIKILLTTGNEQ